MYCPLGLNHKVLHKSPKIQQRLLQKFQGSKTSKRSLLEKSEAHETKKIKEERRKRERKVMKNFYARESSISVAVLEKESSSNV